MDKRKLSAIPRESATEEMVEMADRLDDKFLIVTARMVEENKILLLYFYEVSELKKRNTEAILRTFLSEEDYITQDMRTSKVKWLTGGFENLGDIHITRYGWNENAERWMRHNSSYIWSAGEKKLITDFFADYICKDDYIKPWDAVYRFQQQVREKRLNRRHQKELAAVDAVMEPITDTPQEFTDWVWETGMSFSRYLIYKETQKGKAECECTHCKKIGIVSRNEIRLRNNEKGNCPFCGSKVTFKAKGRLPYTTHDERWFVYIEPMQEGFMLRYFNACRSIRSDKYLEPLLHKARVSESIGEYVRSVYTFPEGKPKYVDYDWAPYKNRGEPRWCPSLGRVPCQLSILYPVNLPQAWVHTPMKYSALEILSANMPTTAVRYEDAIYKYLKFPKLEWLCKMGLNRLAIEIINGERYGTDLVGKINEDADTIYRILGLTKINTKIMQAIDGTGRHLRLLQVSQEIGLQFTAAKLAEYFDTFGCNTNLLKQAKRKVSLHKLVKYISKESERYPVGDNWRKGMNAYYNRYAERPDPRAERKQNMAGDWLEYLGWCKELKYDLDNMFIYMPNNFKAVHDRTAEEYQALKDKKAAAEKKRQERLAKKRMEETRKAMAEIFGENSGTDAFSIRGKGLILVVPKSGDEIKAEGEALHHCVGTYLQRVAEGKTKIFFVRKADAPDVPYFTMEYQGKVVQCRGDHNCGMPPEVQAFVNVFEKKMQEAVNKKKQPHRKAG